MTTSRPSQIARAGFHDLSDGLAKWAVRHDFSESQRTSLMLAKLGLFLAEHEPDVIAGFLAWLETQ